MRCSKRSLPEALLLVAALAAAAAHAQSNPAASPDFFETKVRPVLANNCYSCHTSTAMGGLRVDSRESLLKGGGRGASIVAGDPEKSLLVEAIRQTDPKLKMPMGGRLKDSEIDDIVAWIKSGADWPANSPAATAAPAPGSEKYVIAPERKNFWSLLPLKDPPPPPVKDARWPKTAIDRFVLARLEKEGMKPVRPATRHDMIRRATLDLTGLPPTPSSTRRTPPPPERNERWQGFCSPRTTTPCATSSPARSAKTAMS